MTEIEVVRKKRPYTWLLVVPCGICAAPFKQTWNQKRFCSVQCTWKSKRVPAEIRFWPKVDKSSSLDGCWLWTGAKSPLGYGKFYLPDGTTQAHRFSWTLVNGPVPHGMYICHHCDNPPCVNPNHLFIGDHYDNMADMSIKGRSQHGEKQWNSKLSASDVIEIFKSTDLQRTVAERYGITQGTVSSIKSGAKWKRVVCQT